MKIILVDDNANARGLLCALLTKLGNVVTEAADGQSAIRMAKQLQPDAVILDISMPDMDGYDLAACLRRECGLESVRLIALSGHSPDEDRCQAVGIDHYLLKPARGRQLMELLEHPVAD